MAEKTMTDCPTPRKPGCETEEIGRKSGKRYWGGSLRELTRGLN